MLADAPDPEQLACDQAISFSLHTQIVEAS
jgi:hypothetical protein